MHLGSEGLQQKLEGPDPMPQPQDACLSCRAAHSREKVRTKFEASVTTTEGAATGHQVRQLLRRYGIENPTSELYDEMIADLVAAGRSHFLGASTEIGEFIKLDAKWCRDPANST
jgi:hypothetical protein